ncbi:EKC/KEOPS complex subunit LAGE3-like [Lineus longissimus]|uniref:EKC/KEOPS complex subunit LAGE3-like n=1 Tax=Lineus longissimus TaxID=88925 RepID=UPI002B4D1F58
MEDEFSIDLKVPFPSEREAEIAHGSLSVDKEPKRGGCRKEMSVNGKLLHVTFLAKEAKFLRVSVNSFMDHMALVVETMDQFGPPVKVCKR